MSASPPALSPPSSPFSLPLDHRLVASHFALSYSILSLRPFLSPPRSTVSRRQPYSTPFLPLFSLPFLSQGRCHLLPVPFLIAILRLAANLTYTSLSLPFPPFLIPQGRCQPYACRSLVFSFAVAFFFSPLRHQLYIYVAVSSCFSSCMPLLSEVEVCLLHVALSLFRSPRFPVPSYTSKSPSSSSFSAAAHFSAHRR